MELWEPKRKRRSKVTVQSPFPIPIESVTGIPATCAAWKNCTGQYNGDCVVVNNSQEIFRLYYQGFFGKGSLSRSFPEFGKIVRGIPPFIRQRQLDLRCCWADTKKGTCHTDDVDNKKCDNALSDTKLGSTSDLCSTHTGNDDVVNCSSNGCKENKLECALEKGHSKIDVCQSSQNHTAENKILIEEQSHAGDINACDKFPQSSSDKRSIAQPNQEENMVVVLPDSDDDENYILNMKPKLETDPFPLNETLHLTLEEAFFLSYALGCLKVLDLYGNNLSLTNMWQLFCDSQKDFIQSYVVYHYFRAKNWVVKTGLKFGGDFVLYKQGPPFYHASYIVKVEVIDGKTLEKIVTPGYQTLGWTRLMGLQRLAETAAKEILLCQVVWPPDLPDSALTTPTVLSKFTVHEVLIRRWVSSKEREADWEDLL